MNNRNQWAWNALMFNATPFQCLPVCSSITVEVSHPYRCWYLTHTGVGVSPIHPTVSHPYTQWGLTHRSFRKSGRRLFPLYIISQDSLSSSPLTLARIYHFLALVITASSLSSSPLTLARIHHSLTLVISASSLSSSLRSPFRHLFVLPSVISQLCHSSSPNSVTRHLQALRLVISREITTEAPERTFLSLLGGCKWAQEAYASLLPPKSYLLIPTHHSSNDLFSSDSSFRILLLCNTSIAHLSHLQFLTLFTNCA